MVREENIRLSCPWCGYVDTYSKTTSGEKAAVSSAISCRKCHRYLNHKLNKVTRG